MTKPKRPKKPPHQISIRGDLFRRLVDKLGGRPIGPTVDKLVSEYLDRQERES